MATKPPVGNIVRGDGIRQGLLITPIEIAESEDFVIEWDGIATEAGTFRWWGDETSQLAFAINSGVTAGIQLPAAAGSITFNDAALGLLPSQHYHMKLERVGSAWELTRDNDAPVAGSAPSTTAFTISNFYLGDGVNILPASGAMQNMSITRGGETFFYPMNEGQGSIIYNTDPGTGSPVHISITPTAPVIVVPDVIPFAAEGFGTGTLFLQWKIDGVDIPGEKGVTYDRVSEAGDDGKAITCEATNTSNFTAISNSAVIDVVAAYPPTVTIAPIDPSVFPDVIINFVATATGSAPLTYQWNLDGAPIVGATLATYDYTALLADNAKVITCTVTDSVLQSTTSAGSTLTVALPALPTITIAPVNPSVIDQDVIPFVATAAGAAPLTYQWNLDGAPIGGEVAATYNRTALVADTGKVITCTVTDAASQVVVSAGSTMTIALPALPTIVIAPINPSVVEGNVINFSSVTTGAAPLTFQWNLGGVAIAGATASTYARTTVIGDNGGVITCTVTDVYARPVTSAGSTMTVTPAAVVVWEYVSEASMDPALSNLPASAYTTEFRTTGNNRDVTFVTEFCQSIAWAAAAGKNINVNGQVRIANNVRTNVGKMQLMRGTTRVDIYTAPVNVAPQTIPININLTADGSETGLRFEALTAVGNVQGFFWKMKVTIS